MGNICCNTSLSSSSAVVVGEDTSPLSFEQTADKITEGKSFYNKDCTSTINSIINNRNNDGNNENDDDTDSKKKKNETTTCPIENENQLAYDRISVHTNDIEINMITPNKSAPTKTTFDDLDGTMFHDAYMEMDHFPDYNDRPSTRMSYPPTKHSMRGKSSGIDELLKDTTMSHLLLKESSRSSMELQQQQQEGRVGSGNDDSNIIDGGSGNRTIRKSVMDITEKLEMSPAGNYHGTEAGSGGYPGELTPQELEICLEFREQLKQRDPAYKEMVAAMYPSEPEAFALCRFLRSRDYNIDDVFYMMDEKNQCTTWKKVQQECNFYGHFHEAAAINYCPLPVFMTQYPCVYTGIGKNGAIIWYSKIGEISVPGIECIVGDIVNTLPFLWNQLYHETRRSMEREISCHNDNNTTVLAEKIIVVDLLGDTTIFSAGKEYLRAAPQVLSCFPETVNRTYVLNAPFSFSMIWSVVKHALDPRTLQKIGFFSSISKAKANFVQYIDNDELLSDYGGSRSSFAEVFAERQKEARHKDTIERYICQLICISSTSSLRGDRFDFQIKSNEIVDSILVYSRSNNSCTMSVSTASSSSTKTTNKGGEEAIIDPVRVSREHAKWNPTGKPNFATEIIAPSTSTITIGPGQYTINAKDGTARDYFLIAISVAVKKS
mgnify:CR=1 FL=1